MIGGLMQLMQNGAQDIYLPDDNRYYCIYCDKNFSYLCHIKTEEHLKNKSRIIDQNLLFISKDISNIIIKYCDDSYIDLKDIPWY